MCSSLLSRMFDSVPSGTNLVDVTPIPVKPTAITLTVDASGTMTFKGYIRVRLCTFQYLPLLIRYPSCSMSKRTIKGLSRT